uniref:CCHC-type domain-containing protein n=1 Tax=Anopheles dirus TaxID=7168 RepID=A0A182NU70_9DIPT
MSRYPHDAKVYVGELGNNASKQDIEEAFGYYGPLRNVWVARNPPGFAFVEFEDARDAEDAVRGLDGRTISGRRARVELSTGRGGRGGGGRGGPPRGGGKGGRFQSDDRCYECGGRGHFARDCARSGRRGRKSSVSRTSQYSDSEATAGTTNATSIVTHRSDLLSIVATRADDGTVPKPTVAFARVADPFAQLQPFPQPLPGPPFALEGNAEAWRWWCRRQQSIGKSGRQQNSAPQRVPQPVEKPLAFG